MNCLGSLLKILTSNLSNSTLPVDDKTLNLLKQNHPESNELNEEVLLRGEKPIVYPIVFEYIEENIIKKSSTKDQSWF